jgi:prolyl oligopeptidase
VIAAAAFVARPELFRAVVLNGAPLDMLRYHKGVADPYWTAEYGSPEESEAFTWLLGYSPYQRAAADQRYPAVLLTTGRGDTSVPTFHVRKMAARLQASTTADRVLAPILLRIDEPPPDPSALFDMELRDLVDQWSFLRWLLQR